MRYLWKSLALGLALVMVTSYLSVLAAATSIGPAADTDQSSLGIEDGTYSSEYPGSLTRDGPVRYAEVQDGVISQISNVALLQNMQPWGMPSNEYVLGLYNISYTVIGSSSFGMVNLSSYQKVIISSDQPQTFYTAVESYKWWFEDYVITGGALEIHAADYGWNGGQWAGTLPGGITWAHVSSDSLTIVDPLHPVVTTPNLIDNSEIDNWGASAHGRFTAYPADTHVVIKDDISGYPEYIEFSYGSGAIIASGQTLEYGYYNGDSLILENSLLYQPVKLDHDLSAILDAPTKLSPGDTTLLNATVVNSGLNVENNITLSLLINGVEVAFVFVPTLVNGTSYSMSHLWTPTLDATYNVTASVNIVPGENVTANNVATRFVYVGPIIRVLIDQTHSTDPISYYSSWTGDLTDKWYTIDLLTTSPITAATLAPYAVFVIPQAHSSYNLSEITAIQNFVLNGGGLFVIGDDVASIYTAITSFSGLTWSGVSGVSGYTSDITSHLVTDYVNSAYFSSPVSGILVALPAESLIRDSAGSTMLGVSEIGGGKVVCLADDNCIDNGDISAGDNRQLGMNIMDWLSVTFEHELRAIIDAPRFVQPNNTALLNATVRNVGENTEYNVSLSLLIEGVEVASVVIPELANGTWYSISQNWTPTVKGTYDVTAYVEPVPGENMTGDNTATVMVTVKSIMGYILLDQTHGTDPVSWYSTWMGDLAAQQYTVDLLTVGPITASTLAQYSTFIIPQAHSSYNSSELIAIQNYVLNGGRLIVIGDDYAAAYTALTSFAGMTWDGMYANSGTTTDITPHPVTDGVTSAYFGSPMSGIVVSSPAQSLIRDTGGHNMLAVAELGQGKVVCLADDNCIGNGEIGSANNRILAMNIVDWTARVYEHELRAAVDAPRYVEPGGDALLNATVRNIGQNMEYNVSLSLLVDGVETANVVIPQLANGASFTLSQIWAPTVEGVYNISASVVPVPEEEVPEDNTASTMVKVRPTLGRVLFDQTHYTYPISQYSLWTNDLLDKGYVPETLTFGPVTASVLEPYDVFVIPEPDDYYNAGELAAIEEFVRGGDGLLVMGGYPYASTDLTSFAGMTWDWGGYYGNASMIVPHPVTDGVTDVYFGSVNNTIEVEAPAQWLITGMDGNIILAVAEVEAGAVVSVADSSFVTNWCIGYADNLLLANNVIEWLLMDNPVVDIACYPNDPAVGETVFFDASASYDPDGTIVSYLWDFGDGTTGSGVLATHAYAESGTYTVSLVATDDEGQSCSKTVEVRILRTVLDVQVVVGSLHFGGEMAEFYILVSNMGTPVSADIIAVLYYNGLPYEDLSSSVETAALGLYRIPYMIPAQASTGTYALVAEAAYLSASGTALGSFLVSQTLTGWNALLVQINGTVGTISTDVGVIMVDLDSVNARLQTIEDGIASIDTAIGTIQADIDLIDASIVAIDGRLASVESALGSIQVDIDAINGHIDSINGTLVTVRTDLGLVQTDIVSINAKLAAFDGTLVTIQSSIGTITTSIADIQLKVIALNGSVATIDTCMGEIEGVVTSIDGNVATIQTDLGEVKADVSDVRGDTHTLSIPLYAMLIVALAIVVGVVILVSSARKKT